MLRIAATQTCRPAGSSCIGCCADPGPSISVWQELGRIPERMITGDAAGAADHMRRHGVDAYEGVRIHPTAP